MRPRRRRLWLIPLAIACLSGAGAALADHIEDPDDAPPATLDYVQDTRSAAGDQAGADDVYVCVFDLRGSSYQYKPVTDFPDVDPDGYYEIYGDPDFPTATGQGANCLQQDNDAGSETDTGGDDDGAFAVRMESWGEWWWSAFGSYRLVSDGTNANPIQTPEGPLSLRYKLGVSTGGLGQTDDPMLNLEGEVGSERCQGQGAAQIGRREASGWDVPVSVSEGPPPLFRMRGSFALYCSDRIEDGAVPPRPPRVGALEEAAGAEPEHPEPERQPDASRDPLWRGAAPGRTEADGYFGSGFSAGPWYQGPYAAVGDGRLYVSSPATDKIHVFNAREPAAGLLTTIDGQGSPGGPLADPRGIAYYRGELYVADQANQRVLVLSPEGGYRRQIGLNACRKAPDTIQAVECATLLSSLSSPGGLDLAWGRLFVYDWDGYVKVFDAKTGAFLGLTSDQDIQLGLPVDVSSAPEAELVLAGRQAHLYYGGLTIPWAHLLPQPSGSLLPINRPDSWCGCPSNPRGTEWVWGMRWFMTVEEDGQLIREYGPSRLRRDWAPRDAATGKVSDVAYQRREARIDWAGPLTEPGNPSRWLRNVHSLSYAVSDADIYVVGERGEHHYELARDLDHMEVTIDGVAVTSFAMGSTPVTEPAGTLRINTGQRNADGSLRFPSGIRELVLTAVMQDGTRVQSRNPDLWLDNTEPTGSLEEPARILGGAATLRGTLADEHSGPRDWVAQILAAGQTNWDAAPNACQPAAGPYECSWDTTQHPDGRYLLRARLRDRAKDELGDTEQNLAWEGNLAYSSQFEVIVDNTGPELSLSGELKDREDGSPIFYDERPQLSISAADAGSGVKSIEVTIDGLRDFFAQQACPGGSCGMFRTYTFDASKWTDGTHTVRVIATDHVGRAQDRSWNVTVVSQVGAEAPGTNDPGLADETDNSEEDELIGDGKSEVGDDGLNDSASSGLESASSPSQSADAGESDGICTAPESGDPDCAPAPSENALAALVDQEPPLAHEIPLPPPPPVELPLQQTNAESPNLQAGGAGWGISEQTRQFMRDERFRNLGVVRVRLAVPWDVVPRGDPASFPHWDFSYLSPEANWRDPDELVRVRKWLNRARGKGLSVLVAFERSRGRPNYNIRPGVQRYREAVHAFRVRFPWVKEFSAWNEPNHDQQPFGAPAGQENDGPSLAADYVKALKQECTSACVTVAGDLAEVTDQDYKPNIPRGDRTKEWLRSYMAAIGKHPRWAWHAYLDGQPRAGGERRLDRLQTFLAETLRTQGTAGVWITEAGGQVHQRGLDEAAENFRHLVRDVPPVNGRIKRFYAYQWIGDKASPRRRNEPNPWDSGLTAWWGEHPARQMYFDYRDRATGG